MDTLLAQTICAENGWDPGAIFRWQFLLNTQRAAPVETWNTVTIGSFRLHHCPDLDRTELVGPEGEGLGHLLGIAVDEDGRLIAGGTCRLADARPAALERWIGKLAGRFIAFVAAADGPCVYLDPTCGLSAMFSRELQTVTSNVALALDRPVAPPPHIDRQAVLNGANWFFMGETADRAFTQMRANHKLDLATFEQVRHWPSATETVDFEPGDEVALGEAIASRLRTIMAALLQNFDCALPLTAGKDSRLLFGAALPHIDRLGSLYTFAVNRVTFMDGRVARNIAWDYGVPFQAIVKNSPGFARALPDDALATLRAQMALRTSYVWNGRDDDYTRAVMLAPKSDLTLRGGLCEVTGANKYRRPLPSDERDRDYAFANYLEMSPEEAAEALHPERLAGVRDSYDAWADEFPDALQPRIIDLAHWELWMPGIVNPAHYSFTDSFFMNPFNDRDLVSMSMRVPPGLRKRNVLVNAILDACDPHLKKFPFLYAYIRQIDEAREQGVHPLKF